MPRQNNEAPRTIRERIESRRSLSSTIRAGSADSYGYARSGYVERPSGAGRDMQALAGALSQFDRSLDGYLDKRLEENIEQGTAEGNYVLETKGTDDKGNMLSFKQLTEQNPEYTNHNPWLKRGYEESRLRHLGLKFEKTVNDAMINTGLNNETDMGKIEQFYQTQADAFRKEHGLDAYEDKVLLAKTFSPMLAAVKEKTFNRHSQQIEAQNEVKAIQSYSNLALQGIENGMDVNLNGGVRISGHPGRNKANLSFQAEQIMNAVTEATNHGVRDVNAADMAMGIIVTMTEKNRNDMSPLKLCDMITINGIPLSNFESVAKTRNAIMDRHTARQAAEISRANAAMQRQMLIDKRTLPGRALDYYMQHDQSKDGPITFESILNTGFSKNEAFDVMNALNSMDDAEHKSFMSNPDAIEQKSTYTHMASMGLLDEGTKWMAIQMYGADALPIIKANDAALEGALTDQANAAKQLYSSFATRFSKGAITAANREEVMKTFAETGSKSLPLDYIQGIRAGGHAVAVFSDLVEKARAEKKDGVLTPPQLQSLAMKAELQAQQELNTIMVQLQEQAKAAAQPSDKKKKKETK